MTGTVRRTARAGSGFALPWTLFVLAFLGVVAGTAFVVAWLELGSARSHSVGMRAFEAAEAGLAMALARPGRPPGPDITFGLGVTSATVEFETLLELPGGGALISLVSTASLPHAGVPSSRTTGLAAWMGAAPRFAAALAATGPVTVGGATGTVSGGPSASCPGTAGAGILSWGPVSAGALWITGVPPILRVAPSRGPTAVTGLRWPDLATAAIDPADATVPPDPWPSGGGGWPYIRLRTAGPLGPGHSGRGLIVADGDLDLANGFTWRGLIVIGGALRVMGDVDLGGAILVGADPARVGSADLGDGALSIELDRCAADSAARRLEPYPAAVRGTWFERW